MRSGNSLIKINDFKISSKMSSSGRDRMIKNLREIVVPALRQLNFKGSFPHFRRMTAERINLLTFQFDRNGGGFVIEVANCGLKDYKTALNKSIPPNKLTAHDFYKRKRIQSNMSTKDSLPED
ncbi:MAG: DUF4304 domain-containing protein, partial [Flavobacterium sp.]